jgi:hypothetical protein
MTVPGHRHRAVRPAGRPVRPQRPLTSGYGQPRTWSAAAARSAETDSAVRSSLPPWWSANNAFAFSSMLSGGCPIALVSLVSDSSSDSAAFASPASFMPPTFRRISSFINRIPGYTRTSEESIPAPPGVLSKQKAGRDPFGPGGGERDRVWGAQQDPALSRPPVRERSSIIGTPTLFRVSFPERTTTCYRIPHGHDHGGFPVRTDSDRTGVFRAVRYPDGRPWDG